MYYSKLILYKFLPFTFAKIKYLEWDIESDINIIIGSNGSGKTSLLNELHPFASSSKSFSKDGYKELHIKHNSDIFILSSYFSKSKIYSFKKNDIELNESGLSTIQNELVNHYLNMEKIDRRITSNLYNFSSETAANRNKILNYYSPYKMNKLFNIHNKVKQYIRTFKSQLQLIYNKKNDMENKMLKKEDKNKYLNEEKEHIKKLDEIIFIINKVQREIIRHDNDINLNTVNENTLTYITDTIDEINSLMKEIRYLPNKEKDKLNDDIVRNKTYKQVIEKDLKSLIMKSNELEEKYKNLKEIEILKEHKDELKIINKQLDNLKPDLLEQPLKEEEISELERDMITIKNILDITISLEIKFISLKKYNQRKNIYLSIKRQIESLIKEKELYTKEFNNLQLKIKITPKDIPNKPCAKAKCPLYREFMDEYITLNDKQNTIKKCIEDVDKKLKRKIVYIEIVEEYLSQYEPNIYLIEKLDNLLKRYNVTQKSVYEILNTKDYRILNLLDKYKNKNLGTYMYKVLYKEKEEIEIKISGIEISNSLNKNVLKKSIDEINTSIEDKRIYLNSLQSSLKKDNKDLEYVIKYKELITKLSDIDNFTQDKIKYINEGLYKLYLDDILKILENMKEDVLNKISSLKSILKEDEFINRVYNEEILPVNKELLINIKKYEIMEKALSPTSGIPYNLNKSFIDIIFNYINASISDIFIYPIILKEIVEGEPIDYAKFKVYIDTVEIEDISKLSLSQKDSINLCFIIAIMNICKLNHLPLFLDEIGSSLDIMHQHRLSAFLSDCSDKGLISQLFLTTHTASLDSLSNSDVIVLRPDNIVLPPIYNSNVQIKKYE